MENFTFLWSPHLLLKRQTSRRVLRWKTMTRENTVRFLAKFDVVRIAQIVAAFAIAVISVPLLIYSHCTLGSFRKLIRWKIDRRKGIEIIPDFCYDRRFFVSDLATYMALVEDFSDFAKIKSRIESKVVNDAMKRILTFKYGVAIWKDDPDYSSDKHIFLGGSLKNNRPITSSNLDEYLSEVKTSQRELRRDRPPWQIIIVPMSDSYAVIFQVHRVLLTIHPSLRRVVKNNLVADDKKFGPLPQWVHVRHAMEVVVGKMRNFLQRAKTESITVELLTTDVKNVPFKRMNELLLNIWYVFLSIFQCPSVINTELVRSSCVGINRNPLRIKRHKWYGKYPKKRDAIAVAWSKPVPRAFVDQISFKSRTSTPQLILSCCSGAVKHYLEKYVSSAPDDIYASFPVPFTPWKRTGNETLNDSHVTMAIPTGTPDCKTRLSQMSSRLKEFQMNSMRYLLAGWTLSPESMLKCVPGTLVQLMQEFLGRKHSLSVASSEINAKELKNLFGDNVTRLMYWHPFNKRIGLHLSVIEHDAWITVCIQSNTQVAPEPNIIATGFVRELNELAVTYGLHRSPKISPPTLSTDHQVFL